jgi:hypothetical protein
MARKKRPTGPKSDRAKDLWISPRSNLIGPDGSRAWDNQGNISPTSGARFLELADIALGLKKPAVKKKKAAAAGAHQSEGKTEPYST